MGLQFENLTECLLKTHHAENANGILKTLRKGVHVKEKGLGKVIGAGTWWTHPGKADFR